MPPSKETLATLMEADGGKYDRSACLQALLDSGGDEDLALKILRNEGGRAAHELEVLPVATTAAVVVNSGGGSDKSLAEKLQELNDAKNSGLISEKEFQVTNCLPPHHRRHCRHRRHSRHRRCRHHNIFSPES